MWRLVKKRKLCIQKAEADFNAEIFIEKYESQRVSPDW